MKSKILKFVLIAAAGVLLVSFLRSDPEEKTPEEKAQIEANEAADARAEKINFALTKLKMMIQERMKDPDSYEMVKRTYDQEDKGDTVKLQIQFRGNNSFGGKEVTTVWATYYLQNDMVEITHQE